MKIRTAIPRIPSIGLIRILGLKAGQAQSTDQRSPVDFEETALRVQGERRAGVDEHIGRSRPVVASQHHRVAVGQGELEVSVAALAALESYETHGTPRC